MIDIKTFALAGNAIFTLTSKVTGTRFTYKVRQSKDKARFYVSLLNGPDNENSYAFFGTIFDGTVFRHGKPDKTNITPNAPSAKGFAWFLRNLNNPEILAKQVDVCHEGTCCRCGRKLTVPSSVESGVGPECAQLMGF